MNMMRASQRCIGLSAAPLLAVLAGCATSAGTPPPSEIPRCTMQETLVCYDRRPSRLEKSSDSLEFCHCENLF